MGSLKIPETTEPLVYERKTELTQNKAPFPVTLRSLSAVEQLVYSELQKSQTAITGYDLYKRIILHYARLLNPKTRPDWYVAHMVELDGVIMGMGRKGRKKGKVPKPDFNKLGPIYNKQFKEKFMPYQVPMYKTVIRLCEDFVTIGWFGKRKIGRRSYYFINDSGQSPALPTA